VLSVVSSAVVATSNNRGQTWQNIYDVGAVYGLKNNRFPLRALAADGGRAASGLLRLDHIRRWFPQIVFNGVWHSLCCQYVQRRAGDGGLHWTNKPTLPANDTLQRGCIWMPRGADICRNLLDFFDMTVDKQGRVEVGYVDGCTDGTCVQAALTAKGQRFTRREV